MEAESLLAMTKTKLGGVPTPILAEPGSGGSPPSVPTLFLWFDSVQYLLFWTWNGPPVFEWLIETSDDGITFESYAIQTDPLSFEGEWPGQKYGRVSGQDASHVRVTDYSNIVPPFYT